VGTGSLLWRREPLSRAQSEEGFERQK
jgi:hypothetical protein